MLNKLKRIFSPLHGMLNTPLIAPIIKDRSLSLVITCACATQITLFALTGHGWQCPIKATLGIPCPGCGLTHATLALFQGNWQSALNEHAFAPFFILGLVVIAVGCLLPSGYRNMLVKLVTAMEQRTGFMAWFLISLMVYWGIRLFISAQV